MKTFGLQLWSIDKHFTTPEDTRESFKLMSELGYSHAQTAGEYSYMSAEDFKALADEYGIEIMGTHYPWALICNEVEATAKYHKVIGAKYVGIGSMPKEARTDKDELLAFIHKFNEMAKIYVEKYGFEALTYHHHSFEFVKIDGKTVMDYLIEGFDPRYTAFVVDTYWAQVGGEDVRAFIERLNGRVACIHLKDLAPCYKYELANGKTMGYLPKYVEVGCGNMKFEGIIKTAEACGCKYFTVEDEYYSTGEPYDSIRISAENIKARFLEK